MKYYLLIVAFLLVLNLKAQNKFMGHLHFVEIEIEEKTIPSNQGMEVTFNIIAEHNEKNNIKEVKGYFYRLGQNFHLYIPPVKEISKLRKNWDKDYKGSSIEIIGKNKTFLRLNKCGKHFFQPNEFLKQIKRDLKKKIDSGDHPIIAPNSLSFQLKVCSFILKTINKSGLNQQGIDFVNSQIVLYNDSKIKKKLPLIKSKEEQAKEDRIEKAIRKCEDELKTIKIEAYSEKHDDFNRNSNRFKDSGADAKRVNAISTTINRLYELGIDYRDVGQIGRLKGILKTNCANNLTVLNSYKKKFEKREKNIKKELANKGLLDISKQVDQVRKAIKAKEEEIYRVCPDQRPTPEEPTPKKPVTKKTKPKKTKPKKTKPKKPKQKTFTELYGEPKVVIGKDIELNFLLKAKGNFKMGITNKEYVSFLKKVGDQGFYLNTQNEVVADNETRALIEENYFIGTREITNKMFKAILPTFNYPAEDADLPATNFSEKQMQDFLNGLNKLFPTMIFDIPTEREWEYAAKEGEEWYPWGNSIDFSDTTKINFKLDSTSSQKVKIVDEYRVALKFKTGSPIELIDIIGNAKEICKAEKKIYKLPVKQKYVLRGGSCVDSILSSRLTTRHPVFSIKQPYIGLRLVVKKKGK